MRTGNRAAVVLGVLPEAVAEAGLEKRLFVTALPMAEYSDGTAARAETDTAAARIKIQRVRGLMPIIAEE